MEVVENVRFTIFEIDFRKILLVRIRLLKEKYFEISKIQPLEKYLSIMLYKSYTTIRNGFYIFLCYVT